MAKSALNGMMIGAGVKLFQSLFNAYVMGNLLKTNVLGARLYPAEIVAAQNIAAGTTSGQPSTGLGSPYIPGDPGPFALGAAQTALPGTTNLPGTRRYVGPPGGGIVPPPVS